MVGGDSFAIEAVRRDPIVVRHVTEDVGGDRRRRGDLETNIGRVEDSLMSRPVRAIPVDAHRRAASSAERLELDRESLAELERRHYDDEFALRGLRRIAHWFSTVPPTAAGRKQLERTTSASYDSLIVARRRPKADARGAGSAKPLRMKASIVLACILFLGCGRGRASAKGQPAPSASAVTLGMELGTCSDDLEVCERECDAGSADRCRRLAATYALGKGADKDEAHATALYEHACDMNDPSACVFAGQMHEYAHGVPKDDAKAARLYERSCSLHWSGGCYNLAYMYERGRGVPLDRAKAAELYQVTCTAGSQTSCEKAKEMREAPPQAGDN
jgi:Sel1 repeat